LAAGGEGKRKPKGVLIGKTPYGRCSNGREKSAKKTGEEGVKEDAVFVAKDLKEILGTSLGPKKGKTRKNVFTG